MAAQCSFQIFRDRLEASQASQKHLPSPSFILLLDFVWTLTCLQLVSIRDEQKMSVISKKKRLLRQKQPSPHLRKPNMLWRGMMVMAWRGMMLMALSAALVDSLVQQPPRSAPVRTTDLLIAKRSSSHRHLLPTFLPLRGGAPTTGNKEIKKGVVKNSLPHLSKSCIEMNACSLLFSLLRQTGSSSSPPLTQARTSTSHQAY